MTFGFTDKNTPAYKKYLGAYSGEHGEPGAYSGYSYDGAMVLLTAIKNAKSTDPKKIKAEIMKMDMDGASKHIKFMENGDSGSDYIIYTVVRGPV